MAKLKTDHDKALELLSAIDPKEAPYDSKYKARDIFKELSTNLPPNESDPFYNALMGGLYAEIGVIDIDVEELSEGEKNLLKSLSHFEDLTDKKYCIISEIKALNQLGILWCLRDDYRKAKTYLERSLETYKKFEKHPDCQLYELGDLFNAKAQWIALPIFCAWSPEHLAIFA